MTSARTAQSLAISACVLGVVALGLLGSSWVLNSYPASARCETADGYAAIRAHAQANGQLAFAALLLGVVGTAVCIAGAIRAADHRLAFVVGVVPFVAISLVSIPLLIVSGLYCQN